MNFKDPLKAQAWIGDAVLALYARLRILREQGEVDGPTAVRMSSNQFLSAWGDPTEVEAEIGRAYAEQGLDAAFRLIEGKLMPVFDRQESKRKDANPQRARRIETRRRG
jgi:dsRNA-specific ribonuclease